MKPQTAAVLALLRAEGRLGITPAFARQRVGTDRLAARIAELRADGYVIETAYVTNPTRGGSRFARYILVEHPEQLTAFSSAHDGNTRKVAIARAADGRRAVTARPGAG